MHFGKNVIISIKQKRALMPGIPSKFDCVLLMDAGLAFILFILFPLLQQIDHYNVIYN